MNIFIIALIFTFAICKLSFLCLCTCNNNVWPTCLVMKMKLNGISCVMRSFYT